MNSVNMQATSALTLVVILMRIRLSGQQSGLVFAIFIGFGIVIFFIKVFNDAILSHANSPKPTHPISIVS